MNCSCGERWCDARNVCSAALVRNRQHAKSGGRGRAGVGPEAEVIGYDVSSRYGQDLPVPARDDRENPVAVPDWTACGAPDCEICESHARSLRERARREAERRQMLDDLRESIQGYPDNIWTSANARPIRWTAADGRPIR